MCRLNLKWLLGIQTKMPSSPLDEQVLQDGGGKVSPVAVLPHWGCCVLQRWRQRPWEGKAQGNSNAPTLRRLADVEEPEQKSEKAGREPGRITWRVNYWRPRENCLRSWTSGHLRTGWELKEDDEDLLDLQHGGLWWFANSYVTATRGPISRGEADTGREVRKRQLRRPFISSFAVKLSQGV